MKSISTQLTILSLCCLVLISACSDNSTGSEEISVEGLWKLKSAEGDISYIDISLTKVTSYDFQGDAYDEGQDCFIIMANEIMEKNGDMYKFANPFDPENPIEVRITVANDELTVEESFGSGTVNVKFSRFSGNTTDFTPECAEEIGQAKSKIFAF